MLAPRAAASGCKVRYAVSTSVVHSTCARGTPPRTSCAAEMPRRDRHREAGRAHGEGSRPEILRGRGRPRARRLLENLDPDALRRFRATWKDSPLTASKNL